MKIIRARKIISFALASAMVMSLFPHSLPVYAAENETGIETLEEPVTDDSAMITAESEEMPEAPDTASEETVSSQEETPQETEAATEETGDTEEAAGEVSEPSGEVSEEASGNTEVTETSEEEKSNEVPETATEEKEEAVEETKDESMVSEEASKEASGETTEEATVETTSEEEVTKEATETEEETEEAEEVPAEPVPTFDQFYDGVDVSGLDFSSCELLIGTQDSSIFTADTEVVSEYKGIYLTRYPDPVQTMNAYSYYYTRADLVDVNTVIKASEGEENTEGNTEASDDDSEVASDDDEGDQQSLEENAEEISETSEETETAETEETVEASEELPNEGHGEADMSGLNTGDDAISNINDVAIANYSGYIALIDSGASVNENVKGAVTVLGGGAGDDNGHGTKMAQAMTDANPDVNILSIKALGSDATGTVADVYAAIQYAISANVSVINLSMSALASAESEVLEGAVAEARANGITVIASAGNNGRNASYYTPGNISGVITIGAADEDGNILSTSNRGSAVDYYVTAESTSVAAAKFSAYYVKNGLEGIEEIEGVFTREYAESDKTAETSEEATEEDTEETTEVSSEETTEETTEETISEEDKLEIELTEEQKRQIEENDGWYCVSKADNSLMRTPSARDYILRGADSASENYEWIEVSVTLTSYNHADSWFIVSDISCVDPAGQELIKSMSSAHCVDPNYKNPISHTGQSVSVWKNYNYPDETRLAGSVFLKYVGTENGYWKYSTTGEGYYGHLVPNTAYAYPNGQRVQLTTYMKPISSGKNIEWYKCDKDGNPLSNVWFGVYAYKDNVYHGIGYAMTDGNGYATYEVSGEDADKYDSDYYYIREFGYYIDGGWYADPLYYDTSGNQRFTFSSTEGKEWAYSSGVGSSSVPYDRSGAQMRTSSAENFGIPCANGAYFHTVNGLEDGKLRSEWSIVWDNYSNDSCSRLLSSDSSWASTIVDSHDTKYYAAIKKVDGGNTGLAIPGVSMQFYRTDTNAVLGTAVTDNEGIASITFMDTEAGFNTYKDKIKVKETSTLDAYKDVKDINGNKVNVNATFTSKGFASLDEAKNWAKTGANLAKNMPPVQLIIKKQTDVSPTVSGTVDTSKVKFTYYYRTGASSYAAIPTSYIKESKQNTTSNGNTTQTEFDVTINFDLSSAYDQKIYIREDSTSAKNAGFDITKDVKINGTNVSPATIYNGYYGIDATKATSIEAVGNKAVTLVQTSKRTYAVGIKKVDKNTKAAMSGTKFDVYYRDSAGTTGGTKINTYTTDANGLIRIDVTDFYLNGHKYFYATEVSTDDNHIIDTTKTRALTVKELAPGVSYTTLSVNDMVTFENPKKFVGIYKKDSNGNNISATFDIYAATSAGTSGGTKITTLTTNASTGKSTWFNVSKWWKQGYSYFYATETAVNNTVVNMPDSAHRSIQLTVSENEEANAQFTTKVNPHKIYLKLKKEQNLGGTDYPSLKGAVYSVYDNAECTGTALFTMEVIDDAGNTAVKDISANMTYNYSTNKWNSKTFYAKETKVPSNGKYELNKKIASVTVTDANAATNANGIATNPALFKINGSNPKNNQDTKLFITKKSSNPACTDGNPNYSLEGTTFKVFTTRAQAAEAMASKNYTNAVLTFVTDKNGKTTAQQIPDSLMKTNPSDGTYMNSDFYVIETAVGKNYLLRNDPRNDIFTVTISPSNTEDNPKELTVSNKPTVDPLRIEITKKDESGNDVPLGNTTLEGAQFTVKFYPQDITGTFDSSKAPARTWVYETKKDNTGKFVIFLNEEDYIVSGPELYRDDDDKAGFPLGFVTIQETKAPEGYKTKGDFTAELTDGSTVTADSNRIMVLVADSDGIAYQNHELIDQASFIKNDAPIRADIELWKVDESNNPMEGVKFRVTNKDTNESVILVTDENGYVSTAASYVSHLENTNGGVAKCGTWFGDIEKITDDYGALFYADYEIRELRSEANAGKQLELTRTITKADIERNDGKVITVYDPDAEESENKNWNMVKPTFRTNAYVLETSDGDDKLKVLAQKDSDVADYTNQTIVDEISFEKLRADTDYTWYTQLMVMDRDGNITPYIGKDGKELAVVTPYTTPAAYNHSIYEISGKIDVNLEGVDPSGYEENQKIFVVYETLYLGTYNSVDELPSEEDVITRYPEYDEDDDMDFFPILERNTDDESGQTVKPVDIHTTAEDTVSEDHIAYPSGKGVLKDRVYYTGLHVDKEYTISGTIMVKEGHTWNVTEIPSDDSIPADETDGEDVIRNSKGEVIREIVRNDDGTVTYLVDDLAPAEQHELLDADGNPVVSEVTFIAMQSEGYIDITFEFDASILMGRTIVAFEELRYNNKVLAVHHDINDEDEFIHYPNIFTTARNTEAVKLGKTDEIAKEVPATASASITDTIHYQNLLSGRTYVARGVLMDRETGEPMRDAAGNVISGETTFTTPEVGEVLIDKTPDAVKYEMADGTVLDLDSDHADYKCDGDVDVVFEGYDLTNLAGKSGVVYEEVYLIGKSSDNTAGGKDLGGKEILVGEHKELDTDQFISIIEIHTKAKDATTGMEVVPLDKETIIEDTVFYDNVIPGKEYELTATLHVKNDESGTYKDGDVLLDKDGNPVTVSITFIPEDVTGEQIVEIPFDTTNLRSMEIVVFEDMKNSYGLEVAAHNDLEDDDQTVEVVGGKTTATDDETKDHVLRPAEKVSITDTITYTMLKPGYEYTAVGKLMVKETGKALLDKDGKEITNTVKFKPEKKDGTVDVPFTFDSSLLKGKTIVVFEDVYYEDIEVFMHHELSDEEQSVHVPDGHTVAIGNATKDHILLADKEVSLTDTIYYENLKPGLTYTATGTLMLKSTGKELLGSDGKPITNTVKFTPAEEDGTVKVPFTIDASLLKGETIVVFEDVYYNDIDIFIHHDIDDEDQSVKVPGGETKATNKSTNDHVAEAGKITIIDEVTYTDLIAGEEYETTGVLMLKSTGKPLLDKDGKEIRNTVKFTAEKSDGVMEVPFEVDATLLKGETIVVFEDVLYKGVEVFMHHDINDEDQSVHVPGGKTTALGDNTKAHVIEPAEKVKLTDTISYTNLVPGVKYKATGKLMLKSTGKALKDSSGKEIINTVEFTPKTADGTVDVPFEVNSSLLKGETIVVFEDVEHNGVDVFVHHDINDEDQSVHVPDGKTTAKDDATNDHVSRVATTTTITDTISYTNLVPGLEYTATGTLYSKASGKPFTIDNKPITNTVTFIPEKADGTVDIPFTINTSLLEGSTIVVFEDVYYNGVEVFIHHDINDADQSVYIPKIGTKATVNGVKSATGSTTTTIVDRVEYSNLIVGTEYTVKGVLYDKNTKEKLVINGKNVTAEKTFTAETTDGYIELEFTFDASSLNTSVVVFEKLYHNEVEVEAHEDITDEGQTVTIVPPTTPPATPPHTGSTVFFILLGLLAAGAVGMFIFRRKREDTVE